MACEIQFNKYFKTSHALMIRKCYPVARFKDKHNM